MDKIISESTERKCIRAAHDIEKEIELRNRV